MPYSPSGTGEGAEGAGLEGVDADVEIRGVELADHVGPGEHQHLVAALELRTAEIVGGEVPGLDARAEGAIEDDHPFGGGVDIAAAPHPTRLPGAATGLESGSNQPGPFALGSAPMKIYTRKGDDGTTGLLFGGRVAKNAPQPSAYGVVDEAQAFVGLARAEVEPGF